MCAYDPSYRALHKASENGVFEGQQFNLRLMLFGVDFFLSLKIFGWRIVKDFLIYFYYYFFLSEIVF